VRLPPEPVPLSIAADHPAFAGHFPGVPIVPGVVLLDRVILALEALAPGEGRWHLANVKFVSPVGPGEPVEARFTPGAGEAIAFRLESAGRHVASGSLNLRRAAP